MKRTCSSCKAMNNSFKRCDLGYEIGPCKYAYGLVVGYKPLEECPKPKTNKEFVNKMRQKILK